MTAPAINSREPAPSALDADLRATTLKQRSVRGSLVTLSCQALDSFLRIASIAILARMLIPESFGLVSMVTALTTVAERFKDLGEVILQASFRLFVTFLELPQIKLRDAGVTQPGSQIRPCLLVHRRHQGLEDVGRGHAHMDQGFELIANEALDAVVQLQ